MKKSLKILFCFILALVCAAGIFLSALVYTIKTGTSTDLSALNLPQVQVYRELYMHCANGFYAYVMPWYDSRENPRDLRADAMDAISAANGWHTEPVTAAAFAALLQACQVSLPLHPAEDAVYDAWFFRHESLYPEVLPAQRPAGQWTLSFFDRDSGTFITLTQADTTQDTAALKPSLTVLGLSGLENRLGTLPVLLQDTPVSLTAFEIPAALRGTILSRIDSSGIWQKCSISGREAASLLANLQEEVWPCLVPSASAAFDWHCQQGTHFALYDPDTGLFIYYESDA